MTRMETLNTWDKQELNLPMKCDAPAFCQLLGCLTRRLASSC